MQKYVVFRLESQSYGAEIEQVESIETVRSMTRLPETPPFLKGLMDLRGTVIPVIDLKAYFGMKAWEHTDDARVIIVRVRDVVAGILVDAAENVIDIEQLEPAPEVVGMVTVDHLKGIAKDGETMIAVLDLHRILNPDDVVTAHQKGISSV